MSTTHPWARIRMDLDYAKLFKKTVQHISACTLKVQPVCVKQRRQTNCEPWK